MTTKNYGVVESNLMIFKGKYSPERNATMLCAQSDYAMMYGYLPTHLELTAYIHRLNRHMIVTA